MLPIEVFQSVYPYLQARDYQLILPKISHQHYEKDSYLIRNGQVATHLYYMTQGAVKCYSPDLDRLMWAEFEAQFFTMPDSFVYQVPSKEDLIIAEPSEVYKIAYQDLEALYSQHTAWANWGRKLAEQWTYIIDHSYRVLLLKSATEKYEAVQALRPDILQRASLKDIASYLGISQVSVSRIRANTQEKKRN